MTETDKSEPKMSARSESSSDSRTLARTRPTDKLYDADSFGEFWDRYEELHANPKTRAAHAIATASALGLVALAIARRSWKLALLAPIIDYTIAQLSHRTLDGTTTHPTRRPLWHARAEWRLFRKSLRDAEHYVYRRM